MKKFDQVKNARKLAREQRVQPEVSRIIPDKRKKPAKHKKPEYGVWIFHCDDL